MFYINFENGKFVRPLRSNEQFLFFSVFFDASFARYNVQGREATKGTCTCLVMSVSHSVKDQRVSLWINQSIDVIITCKPISQLIRFYVSQSGIQSKISVSVNESNNQLIDWAVKPAAILCSLLWTSLCLLEIRLGVGVKNA